MSREVQVRFCERRGVRFPPPTLPVVHCVTERQANEVLAALAERMESVGLRLHAGKTKIVDCKDGLRRRNHEHTSFTFLGYTFGPRQAIGKDGKPFLAFLPAVSREALKAMGQQVRQWRLHMWVNRDLNEIAREINPVIRGWMSYYGRFYRSRMIPVLQRINTYLMRWAGKKYKRLCSYKRFRRWWSGWSIEIPDCSPTGGGCARSPDSGETSGVTGDCHAPFRGSPGVRFPRATRLKMLFALTVGDVVQRVPGAGLL